jgi:hypothetical protein
MGSRLNRESFEKLVQENIDWLMGMPRTLERDHIKGMLETYSELEYCIYELFQVYEGLVPKIKALIAECDAGQVNPDTVARLALGLAWVDHCKKDVNFKPRPPWTSQ